MRRSIEALVDDGLEGVLCFGCLLEVVQRIRQRGILRFHFDQEPWFAIAYNQEIHFALELVTQVAQFEFPKTHIGPSFYRFEQMTGHKSFCPLARIFDARPIAQEPFGFLVEWSS